jgi:hypothetical protein
VVERNRSELRIDEKGATTEDFVGHEVGHLESRVESDISSWEFSVED